MKKALTLTLLAAVLFLGACKKGTDTASPTTTGDNNWTLAGTTYKTFFSYRSALSGGSTLLSFYDATPSATVKVNSLSLSFITVPTTSGTYHLVSIGQAKTADQFEISVGTTVPTAYAFVGASSSASVDVAITVTAGKLKIVIPETTLKATTSIPDAKIMATLQEI